MIDVEEDHRVGIAVPAGDRMQLLDPLAHRAAVQETGQAVLAGELFELHVGGLELGSAREDGSLEIATPFFEGRVRRALEFGDVEDAGELMLVVDDGDTPETAFLHDADGLAHGRRLEERVDRARHEVAGPGLGMVGSVEDSREQGDDVPLRDHADRCSLFADHEGALVPESHASDDLC